MPGSNRFEARRRFEAQRAKSGNRIALPSPTEPDQALVLGVKMDAISA